MWCKLHFNIVHKIIHVVNVRLIDNFIGHVSNNQMLSYVRMSTTKLYKVIQ